MEGHGGTSVSAGRAAAQRQASTRLAALGCPSRRPAVARDALERPKAELPRAWLHGTFDFSFSGLKTAPARIAKVHHRCRGHSRSPWLFSRRRGWRANWGRPRFRRRRRRREPPLREATPLPGAGAHPPWLCTDNAAIGAVAGHRLAMGQRSLLTDIFTTNQWARVAAEQRDSAATGRERRAARVSLDRTAPAPAPSEPGAIKRRVAPAPTDRPALRRRMVPQNREPQPAAPSRPRLSEGAPNQWPYWTLRAPVALLHCLT
jgi:hypothetical protein